MTGQMFKCETARILHNCSVDAHHEHYARWACIERGRDPDREMTGPDGPFPAWQLYAPPRRTLHLNWGK